MQIWMDITGLWPVDFLITWAVWWSVLYIFVQIVMFCFAMKDAYDDMKWQKRKENQKKELVNEIDNLDEWLKNKEKTNG